MSFSNEHLALIRRFESNKWLSSEVDAWILLHFGKRQLVYLTSKETKQAIGMLDAVFVKPEDD